MVLHHPDLEDENKVLDNSKDLSTLSVEIEVHALTRLQVNQISEEIRNIIKVTARNDLRQAALFAPDISGSSEDSDFIGGVKYYTKSMTYVFERFD